MIMTTRRNKNLITLLFVEFMSLKHANKRLAEPIDRLSFSINPSCWDYSLIKKGLMLRLNHRLESINVCPLRSVLDEIIPMIRALLLNYINGGPRTIWYAENQNLQAPERTRKMSSLHSYRNPCIIVVN